MRPLLLAAPTALAAGQAPVVDPDLAGWQAEVTLLAGNASAASAAVAIGGNSGAARSVEALVAGPGAAALSLLPEGVGELPGATGGLAAADLAVDVSVAPSAGGGVLALGFTCEQAGVRYTATATTTHVPAGGGWTPVVAAGLTALDFTAQGATPDFSSGGAPVRFGLWASASNGAPFGVVHVTATLDNFARAVTAGGPVACGSVASSAPLGSACGALGPLLFTSPPVPGAGMTVGIAGAPGVLAHVRVAPDTGTELDLGGCALHLDPAASVALADLASGAGGFDAALVALPASPGLCGLRFVAQGVAYPTASALGFDLTNAVALTVGS